MTENQIAKILIEIAFKLHRELGSGLLESVYERLIFHELSKQDLNVEKQVPVNIHYDGQVFENAFRADLIIDNKVIVEVKSIESLNNAHKKQLLTYLRLTDMKLGLLLNFGAALLKDGIVRIVNNL